MEPEKTAKILSHLASSTPINYLQLGTIIAIRKGLGRAGLRRKIPGTNSSFKPKVFS